MRKICLAILLMLCSSITDAAYTGIEYYYDAATLKPVAGLEITIINTDGKPRRLITESDGRLEYCVNRAGDVKKSSTIAIDGKEYTLSGAVAEYLPYGTYSAAAVESGNAGVILRYLSVDEQKCEYSSKNRYVFSQTAAVALDYKPCDLTKPLDRGLKVSEKIADMKYLYQIMSANYPFFWLNQRDTGYQWLDHYGDFMAAVIDSRDNREFFDAVSECLSKLNNRHTYAMQPAEEISQRQKMRTADWYKAWADTIDTPAAIAKNNWWLANEVTGVRRTDLELLARPRSQNAQQLAMNDGSDINRPDCTVKLMAEGKALYIKFPNLRMHYDANEKYLRDTLKNNPQLEYAIIDIQDNPGGSDEYIGMIAAVMPPAERISATTTGAFRGSEFIKPYLQCRGLEKQVLTLEELPALPRFPVEIRTEFRMFVPKTMEFAGTASGKALKKYLLVNKGVYSAAESLAQYFKASGYAEVIGSVTGGDGAGVGMGPAFMLLPNSGIAVRFSTCMGLNSDGSADDETKTVPDHIVDADNDPDAALNKALELIKLRKKRSASK